ncbi:hypothetical protein GCM10022281_13810 [Sphingomonas rosea]|uniref:Anti-sigma factor NepR domain-containing protein n=1 Tax=Sphingomonas rosea TaxID=335605 RepID=A0ABP7U2H0_9SPHN
MRQATQLREGIEGLSADNGDRPKSPNEASNVKKTPPKRGGSGPDDVGRALRSAYDEALREDVPDDFLDLLGKLS